MNINLVVVGKTDSSFINEGVDEYFKRVKRYINFEFKIVKDIKNAKNIDFNLQKQLEGDKILLNITAQEVVVLLDENGTQFSSKDFAGYIEKQMNASIKNLTFVIGGPYGFSEAMYKRANYKISLSKMTFSHQIIRLIFAEQLYRAFSIINNEPYHHE